MLLEEKKRSIKLCLSAIIRDLRWDKQKTIQVSPFQAYFGRLPKIEFKILRDKFITNSDYFRQTALGTIGLDSIIAQTEDRSIQGEFKDSQKKRPQPAQKPTLQAASALGSRPSESKSPQRATRDKRSLERGAQRRGKKTIFGKSLTKRGNLTRS